MSDFSFLQNPYARAWVISAPRRATRPNESKGETAPVCPFCPGNEAKEPEAYRVGGEGSNWSVRVIPNKFPFAPIHEVIICSPDHHKGLDELPLLQMLSVFEVYRERFRTYRQKGHVYIFHNAGAKAGESILHPHTQLAVIPFHVRDAIPSLRRDMVEEMFDVGDFEIFCPAASQWPDEVWVRPTNSPGTFADISDQTLGTLTKTIQILIQLFALRHGEEFPYNFYIYPREDWYVRLIPRAKTLGGFEVGTGISVNTQDPRETLAFIKTHFYERDEERIRTEHQAQYHKAV